MRTGHVALIGGGPGPLDLMTVRAHRLLRRADVVIADRLGPAAEALEELVRYADLIDVGKRPGHHPAPQEEINRLLVEHALAGRDVARLKGGDPYVFGRGGEELTACLAAGVDVEVVPGVSSAIAVPQAAGIPATHRGTASAIHIVHGQEATSAATLAALADDSVTTMVLMGIGGLPRLVSAALAHGVPAARPVAVVENGHTPRQRTTRSTLAEIVEVARAVGIASPAVIVIGEVAREGFLPVTPGFAAGLPVTDNAVV